MTGVTGVIGGPADRIELSGLRIMALCGILDEELVRSQPFEVDVVIETDLTDAGSSDDLADTIDYGGLTDRLVALALERHHGLMEHLVARLAETVLAEERVTAVEISIRKLRPPVAHDLRSAGVWIRRTR